MSSEYSGTRSRNESSNTSPGPDSRFRISWWIGLKNTTAESVVPQSGRRTGPRKIANSFDC